jgi:tRNA U34 2-thiouridine synthase MnmA/TrmU
VNWHPAAGVTDPGYNAVAGGVDRGSFKATVKIRYSHPGTPASVTPLENNRAHIHLHEPQRAVTPGQAAVIYDRDMVLGGGWICRREALVPV